MVSRSPRLGQLSWALAAPCAKNRLAKMLAYAKAREVFFMISSPLLGDLRGASYMNRYIQSTQTVSVGGAGINSYGPAAAKCRQRRPVAPARWDLPGLRRTDSRGPDR